MNAAGTAFLFPGQGAQYVGMGRDFFDNFAEARAVFEEADEYLSMYLSRLMFQGTSEELTLTKNSQLAIYVVSVAILRVLQAQWPALCPEVCAGLSLGEYTALVGAGKWEFVECLRVVQARAACMHAASEARPGGMRVVLGLEEHVVREVLTEVTEVWVANLNCPSQIVISGSPAGIELATALLQGRGAKRVLSLDVSGAFHSGYMIDAQKKLAPHIATACFHDTPISVVMNVPGDFVDSVDAIRTYLLSQVTETVRWEKGVRSMLRRGISRFIEIGCGKTLSGINRKIGVPEASIYSVEMVKDLDRLFRTQEALCDS